MNVKRFVIPTLLSLSLIVTSMPIASASITPGTKCSKVGAKQTFKGDTFTCVKSGLKLVWSKGVKVDSYDAAFAKSHLLEAQASARQILADAKTKADQIQRPPNCTTRDAIASASFGTSEVWLSALIFNNPGICDITVRASAAFLCPDGRIQKISNYVVSTGIFPLRAGEKLSVAVNVPYYFPQVLNECRSLTGYSSSVVSISTYHQPPSVMTLTSNYAGNFNKAAATKQANQLLASAKARASKLVADAKNPILIAKAWQAAQTDAVDDAEIAAGDEDAEQRAREWNEKYYADLAAEKIAAEKIAAEKIAAEKIAAEKIAAEKAAAAVDEALGKACVVGGICKVGRTGPGGGIVFYDAGSQQSWGRYLEFAPIGWSGVEQDPVTQWCEKTSVLVGAWGKEMGTGKSNTDLMLAVCTSGAAVEARAYKGGGKSDWYLPSAGEFELLCKFARYQVTSVGCERFGRTGHRGGFGERNYWTSSESNAAQASLSWFGVGGGGSPDKIYTWSVRPIRAF